MREPQPQPSRDRFDPLGGPDRLLAIVAARWVGPVVTVVVVAAAVQVGWAWSPRHCGRLAAFFWLLAVAFLGTSAACRTEGLAGRLVAIWLIGYALVLPVLMDLGLIWDKEGYVARSALLLLPAVAGGVRLPRSGEWATATACWCLLFGATVAVTATVANTHWFVGFFSMAAE